MKKIPFNIKKVLFNNAGQTSYIEFSVGFIMLLTLLVIVVQVYGLMQAETVAMNAAKDALRRVELNGGEPSANLTSDVTDALSKIKGISNISIKLDGMPIDSVPAGHYQLRNDITLELDAKYSFNILGIDLASIPIAIKYTGSSEKFNKNLPYTLFN